MTELTGATSPAGHAPELTGALFVHGLFSDETVWDRLVACLSKDSFIQKFVRLRRFRYASPWLELNPLRRIPALREIGESLGLFLDTDPELRACSRLVLIGHSQGGLVIQAWLSQALQAGRTASIKRVREIVLLATPNYGSELLRSVRKSARGLRLWWHPQERALQPYDEGIEDIRRVVFQQALHASALTVRSCPMRFSVFAGDHDNIVRPVSAKSAFPGAATLPGDHFTIVQPGDENAPVCTVIRTALRRARAALLPSGHTMRVVSIDPTSREEIDAVASLQTDRFDVGEQARREDLHHWLEHYEEQWGLRVNVLVARKNEEPVGYLMFHEAPSASLMVVDYVAIQKGSDSDNVILREITRQMQLRAGEIDAKRIVFEVKDPRLGEATKSQARIKLFEKHGARIIGGIEYLAADMQGLLRLEELDPYLLMYASVGRGPATLSRAEVMEIVRFLYLSWYRNWFSRRYDPDVLSRYLEGLSDHVAAGIPQRCPLLSLSELLAARASGDGSEAAG